MSTHVEGASPPVIRVTAVARLLAGPACLTLTVAEEGDGLWKYTLSAQAPRRGYGRLMAPDHLTALRRAAQILADGYLPGTAERGLLENFGNGSL